MAILHFKDKRQSTVSEDKNDVKKTQECFVLHLSKLEGLASCRHVFQA